MLRLVTLVMLTSGLVACTSDSTSPNGSIVGTYSARSINGFPLPYALSSSVALTSDILTLNSDGTYTDMAQYSDGTARIQRGFFTNTNGSITFDDRTDGLTYTGSVSGNVLTEFTVDGSTIVYQKS
jgi:hypothetical protein